MGKRYGFILLLLLSIEVEQGLGARQHLAMWIAGGPIKNRTSCWDPIGRGLLKQVTVLLVVRICSMLEVGGGMLGAIGFALCECSHGSHSIDIMDADFFDESMFVIAFRSQEDGMSLRQSVIASS